MTNFQRFNDGVASFYKENAKRSNFSAKENARGLEDLTFICKLDFEEMSKRQQDQEFAQQNGHTLTLKIRTRLVPVVDSSCKVVIGDTLYDIYDIDKSKKDFSLYLYLEEVRQLDT